ncbi:WbuC family cupin fold metalloprotein [Seonamhaeicola marinus]|uniref:Cupin fold metalloprotein, WbuC family n=1 Tax=Seonamhaeicola marinus TaxID=1912246 RepID=A0A5D0HTT1_9FLAO|nr:WbuC family cupin fold metalloprotein [Seonamhaeicola marinus]TYA74803.1 cupin fold metalloprotein, WbuC family [Seonamhaeicola marinus]
MSNFPLATNPPKTDVTLIENALVETAVALSKESPRKRIISPLHKSASDTLHRMLNVIQPGSYIRPHSHETDQKAESIIVLRVGICFLTFDESGNVSSHHNLYANSDTFGVDLEPNVIHSFFALEEDTVIFEVKPGPYIKKQDKGFAEWAPEENSPEADLYLKQLIELTQ